MVTRQGSKQSNAFFYISPAGGSLSTAVGCIDSNSLLLLRPSRTPALAVAQQDRMPPPHSLLGIGELHVSVCVR